MAQAGVQVQLSVKEIYGRLCPKCRDALRDLVKEKLTDQLVAQVVGPEAPEKEAGR